MTLHMCHSNPTMIFVNSIQLILIFHFLFFIFHLSHKISSIPLLHLLKKESLPSVEYIFYCYVFVIYIAIQFCMVHVCFTYDNE
jgi:hypothetical protein